VVFALLYSIWDSTPALPAGIVIRSQVLLIQEVMSYKGAKLERLPSRGAGLWPSESSAMLPIERIVSQIAPTNIPILLMGESGTGKEFIAQLIHNSSSHENRPLLKAICASLSGPSVTTYFEGMGNPEKSSGTLFLKEISELDPVSQRHLLYALPEPDAGGDSNNGPRLISSTTLNLEEEVRAGRFRIELFYRINGVCLRLPALRQRREDIPALAELFLAKHAAIQGCVRPRLDVHDFAMLKEYSWPGNIRELENVVKQMVVLDHPKAVLSSLRTAFVEPISAAVEINGSALKTAARTASRGVERDLILEALNRTRWNRKRAAQQLQISYKALLYKLKRIGAEEPDQDSGSACVGQSHGVK
jgi:two-component system response regulator AtoC